MASIPVIKICLLGGGCQGKSALVLQFITNTFLTDYDPTIEDTYKKNVTVNNQSALLEILDTAGQKDFWSMQEQWIRDSQIFMLVYSVCSREGFKIADQLRSTVFSVKGTDKVPIILVGTQSDLASERVVDRDEAQSKATSWDCEYIEVSAKSREHLEELFNMAIPLYNTHFAQQHIDEEIGNQARSGSTCVCCVGEDHDDFDDLEEDGDAFKNRQKKDPKIQFFKTEELPPDIIPNPILSLKNFRIARQFHWVRFIGAALSGIFVPLVVVFQTIAILSYSERTEPGCFYPKDYPYRDAHAGLLWDYLGMIVGRKPGQDPETIKDRKWFLRQTGTQKCKRLIFTLIVCVVFVVCCFNLSQIGNFQVSLMESVGPFCLFWIVWLLLSVWIGYEQTLKPPIPAPTRLRSLTIFFGEDFSHRSSVYKFVRAYESSRTNNRWKLTKLRTFIIILLGVFYAITPGLTRLTFGDSDETTQGKKTFFSQDGNYYVEIGALVANFILVSSILYCVEIQYKKQFDNYTVWMNDLTMLLNKTDAEHDVLKAKENEEVVDIPSKGKAFSKDLFISLLRRQNALGWFEIRSFIAVQGQILFAEQELPTLWMCFITCALCLFIFYRAYFIPGNPLESILFNGTAILTCICVVALIRILITAYVLEGIQFLQEKLVAEQKFFMRCNRPYDDMMLDSHAVGMLEEARSKSRSKLADNPLHAYADTDGPMLQSPESDEAIQTQKTDLTEIEMAGRPAQTGSVAVSVDHEAEAATTLVVPLKRSMDDGDEHQDDEKEPLLDSKKARDDGPIFDIQRKVTKIEDVNRYSYNVSFIDDTLVLLKKKDIYPRLFKLKVNSVLSKVVAGCVIAVVVTAFKIFLIY